MNNTSAPAKSPATSPKSPSASAESPLQLRLDSGHGYWTLVVFLVVMSTLGSFVNDMYTPALPGMCRFFGCSVSLGQMGLTMGMIGLGVGQLVLGPVSDRVGRKPVLVVSLIVFILAASLSVFSKSIHEFNIFRFFQGLGASAGYFLARTIPADVFSGRQLAKLMAIVGAINGFAPASAPVIGGFTADAFTWKGVFLLLTIFGVLVLAFSPMLKESLSKERRQTGDILPALKVSYRSLLTNRAFIIHVCLKGFALGLLFAYISASPFILEDHYGLSQSLYGVVIGVNAVFGAAGSMLALKFHPLKKAAVVGSWITALGAVAEAVCLWTVHSFWLFEIFIVVIVFGLGLIFSSANTLAMNEGKEHAGVASSLLGVSGYIVGAVVCPLVGVGDILHSTAITFIVLSALMLVFARGTRKLAPDLDK